VLLLCWLLLLLLRVCWPCLVRGSCRFPCCSAAAVTAARTDAMTAAAAVAVRRQDKELVCINESQPSVLLEVLQQAALVGSVLIGVREVWPPTRPPCAACRTSAQVMSNALAHMWALSAQVMRVCAYPRRLRRHCARDIAVSWAVHAAGHRATPNMPVRRRHCARTFAAGAFVWACMQLHREQQPEC
jgi:hypothetical protein